MDKAKNKVVGKNDRVVTTSTRQFLIPAVLNSKTKIVKAHSVKTRGIYASDSSNICLGIVAMRYSVGVNIM